MSVSHRLPDTVATHIGADGPDGFMTPGGALGFTLGILALNAAVFGYTAWQRAGTTRSVRASTVGSWAIAGLVGYLSIALLIANVDVSVPQLVDFPLALHLPAAAVVGAICSGVGAALTWRI
ncbi:hypothetical protein FNX44_023650 [Streptomyces sp. OF1]|uniref:DUF1648 domain-containing protein n=1 Tax=Streptomyces alkaliterrae TaxID=2213162 RepID=A0A5P0YWZ0_9ACTN|nr:hypothetical protein [Streptomyces alkaliterrae]